MQRRTYCEEALAAAEAEGCPAGCQQTLLRIVDCAMHLWNGETCLDYDHLVAAIGADPLAAHALGGALHVPDTIADLNTRVTDATLFGLEHDAAIKGWIQFDGTGVIAIADSFNVSGIVDNGVGDYTVTWNRNFANTNYAVVPGSNAVTTPLVAVAVGSCRIFTYSAAHVGVDVSLVFCIAIGDQ